MNYYLTEEVLWCILVISCILLLLFGILYPLIQLASSQEWTYDDCVNDFDPITCNVMFPPLPLESI